jgi:site-specific recombinase XerC
MKIKTPRPTLAAALHGFFTDYLPRQRALSPHTLYSYRDSLKLLAAVCGREKRTIPAN